MYGIVVYKFIEIYHTAVLNHPELSTHTSLAFLS